MSLDLLIHTVKLAEFWDFSLFQEIKTNTMDEVLEVQSFGNALVFLSSLLLKLGHVRFAEN